MNNEERNDPKKIHRKTVVYKGVKIELADNTELASRSAADDSFEAADIENVEKTEIAENNIEEVSDEGIVAEENADVECSSYPAPWWCRTGFPERIPSAPLPFRWR